MWRNATASGTISMSAVLWHIHKSVILHHTGWKSEWKRWGYGHVWGSLGGMLPLSWKSYPSNMLFVLKKKFSLLYYGADWILHNFSICTVESQNPQFLPQYQPWSSVLLHNTQCKINYLPLSLPLQLQIQL